MRRKVASAAVPHADEWSTGRVLTLSVPFKKQFSMKLRGVIDICRKRSIIISVNRHMSKILELSPGFILFQMR